MKLTLSQARSLATSLLGLAIVCMVVFRLLEPSHLWAGWVRAVCEAATVGALADWFAVVALFRHPMGIPIPHTAILPNNKPRVADSLADFIDKSFLTEEHLGNRFRNVDYAGFLSKWLVANADSLVEKAAGFAPAVLSGISDDEVSRLLAERARTMLRQAELGPGVGEGLAVMVQNGRDREIYNSLLKSADALICSHREMIQRKIHEEIPLPIELLPEVGLLGLVRPALEQLKDKLAGMVANKTIEKVQGILEEAENDPEHTLWKSFDSRLQKFIEDLKSSPDMAEKIRNMQEAIAASTVVDDFAAKAWSELKAFLLRDCAAADSTVRGKLRDALLSIARQLGESEDTRSGLNKFLGEQVLSGLIAARPHAREFISSTVQNWDATEMSANLEATVGADLQFIRLNGTLIGGLIGGFIYGAFWLIGK